MFDQLQSGYVQRGKDTLPRQGSKHPWKVLMHYEKDSKMLLEDPVDDGLLEFGRASVRAASRLSAIASQHIPSKRGRYESQVNASSAPSLRGARPLFGSRRMGVSGRRLMLATLTAAARPPKGTRFERVTIAGVPVDRVRQPRPHRPEH